MRPILDKTYEKNYHLCRERVRTKLLHSDMSPPFEGIHLNEKAMRVREEKNSRSRHRGFL